jgi:hypothetical protein
VPTRRLVTNYHLATHQPQWALPVTCSKGRKAQVEIRLCKTRTLIRGPRLADYMSCASVDAGSLLLVQVSPLDLAQRLVSGCDGKRPVPGIVGAMVGTNVRERPVQSHRDSDPAFDLNVSKLRRPAVRPGTVRRSALIDRLARDDSRPIVSVVAPAGYGKTTLLTQWAERDGRAFAEWYRTYGGTRPDLTRALEFHDRWLPGTMRRVSDITRPCMPQCMMLRGPGDWAVPPRYR